MSDFTETHLPCPTCSSSDAFSTDDAGGGKCFSCGYVQRPGTNGKPGSTTAAVGSAKGLFTDVEFREFSKRGLTAATCRKYGYGFATDQLDRWVHVAPYYDDKGHLVAQKIRAYNKDFYVLGDMSRAGLFGQKAWRAGGKRIVITEGEIDALSVCQALGGTWPAVSVPNGAPGAAKSVLAQLEYLESFEQVVLAFDADEAGQAAVGECVEIFSPGKVSILDLNSFKDPNEMLTAAGPKALRDAVWQAKEWRPDGVICMGDLRARVEAPLAMGLPYPWESLNVKLYGFRPTELITWTAGTGVGKTAIVSELVFNLITVQDVPTGLVYLEETVDRVGKRLVGLALSKPLHLPETKVSPAEFAKAWDDTLGRRNLFAYEHFGSLEADVLLNRIRYMAKACGVRVVVLDHISMVVSGGDRDDDERRSLDYIMTKLKSLAVETGIVIHIVCHLSRPQGVLKSHEDGRQVSLRDLRGTQAIAQLSDAVIAAERNIQATDHKDRNTTTLRVLKNRYAGLTGPAGSLRYDHATARLVDCWDEAEIRDGDF